MMAFVSLVKVARIVAQAQELLYTTTNRRGTSTKIRTLDRLLDQWANTLPDHLQINFGDMAQMSPDEARADLGQGAPEVVFTQLVYLYARLLIHRPALSFKPQTDQSQASLLKCMEVSMQTLLLLSYFRQYLLLFDINPGAHVYTLWQCGLMSLYGLLELKDAKERHGITSTTTFELDARQSALTCLGLLDHMVSCGRDGEEVRAQNIRHILAATAPLTTPPSISEPGSTPASISSLLYAAPPPLLAATNPAQPPPTSPLARFLRTPASASGTPTSPLTLVLASPSLATPSLATPSLATPSAPPMDPAAALHPAAAFTADFATAPTHPYDRLGIAEPHASPPALHSAPGRRTPGDIWDDPVFAYLGSPPQPLGELPDQSPAVIGSSELYEAAPEPKRMRFAKDL